METCFVARDNSGVLTVKLGRETSLVAYSTDKCSISCRDVLKILSILSLAFVKPCRMTRIKNTGFPNESCVYCVFRSVSV